MPDCLECRDEQRPVEALYIRIEVHSFERGQILDPEQIAGNCCEERDSSGSRCPLCHYRMLIRVHSRQVILPKSSPAPPWLHSAPRSSSTAPPPARSTPFPREPRS